MTQLSRDQRYRQRNAAKMQTMREAIEGVLVGGNHLALLIGADHPAHDEPHAIALEHYGAGDQYEIWCCWRSIMQAREALSRTNLREALVASIAMEDGK